MSTSDLASGPIKKEVLRDKIFNVLRESILAGNVKPGERLVESKIAEQLQVSRAPLRDALWQLANHGLVVIEAHRGATVVELFERDIRDIFELRELLETHAAKVVRNHMTAEAERALESAVVKLEQAAQRQDLAEFTKADVEFHKVLYSLAGNSLIKKVLDEVSTRFFGYELIRDLPNAEKFRFSDIAAAHRRMKQLVVEGTDAQIEQGFHAAFAEFLAYVLQRFQHD